MRTAAVVCTVSFTDGDRIAVAPGGWVHSAMQRDIALRDFINTRFGADGVFRPDGAVMEAISRVMTKTAAGLLFHEFGRMVPLRDIALVAVEHAQNVPPSALAESYRRDDAGWAEVRPSGRELERQVVALSGHEPPNMPKWRVYRSVVLRVYVSSPLESHALDGDETSRRADGAAGVPMASRAGPRRKGRPRKRRQGQVSEFRILASPPKQKILTR